MVLGYTSEHEELSSARSEREKILSVVLATSDNLWHQALKAVLETEQIVIVGEPISGEETVRLIKNHAQK